MDWKEASKQGRKKAAAEEEREEERKRGDLHEPYSQTDLWLVQGFLSSCAKPVQMGAVLAHTRRLKHPVSASAILGMARNGQITHTRAGFEYEGTVKPLYQR